MAHPQLTQFFGNNLGKPPRVKLRKSPYGIWMAHSFDAQSAGDGLTQEDCLNAILGETLERQAARQRPLNPRIEYGSYNELSESIPLVPLMDCHFFSESQTNVFLRESIPAVQLQPSTRLKWIQGTMKHSSDVSEIFYPLALIHPKAGASLAFGPYSSNGCAVHTSKDRALEAALFEHMERSAFLHHWWRQSPPKHLRAESLLQLDLPVQILKMIKALGERLYVLDLSDHFDTPCFTSLIFGNTKNYEPAVLANGACRGQVIEALTQCLLEAIRVFISMKNLMKKGIYSQKLSEYDGTVTDFDARTLHYSLPENLGAVEFLKEGETIPQPLLLNKTASPHITIGKRMEQLQRRVFFFDMTPLDLFLGGLHLFKVVMPDEIPLDANDLFRPMGCNALRNVPESNLNPNPHPFS